MKKVILSLSVLALFAIGFSASDEDEKTSSNVAQEQSTENVVNANVSETEIIEKKEEPKEFFEKGHSYISNKWRLNTAVENYCQYELTYYNDGSIELVENETYPNHEYEDWSVTYECKITKKRESKRDVAKEWYLIESIKSSQGQNAELLVDMEGNFYGHYNGKSGYEAVGVRENYQGTFKKK